MKQRIIGGGDRHPAAAGHPVRGTGLGHGGCCWQRCAWCGTHELLAAVCGPEKTRRWTALPAVMGIFSGAAFLRCGPWAAAAAGHCGRAAAGGRDSAAGGGRADLRQASRPDPAGCVRHGAGGAGHPWPPSAACCCCGCCPTAAGLVLVPLVAAFCSDSAALFTGMACGKHKLSPLVSPHKTVEGAVGGLVGRRAGHGDLPDHLLPLYPAAPAHRRLHPHGSGGRSHGPAGRPELFGHQAAVRHQGLWAAAAGSRRRAGPVRQRAVCCARCCGS